MSYVNKCDFECVCVYSPVCVRVCVCVYIHEGCVTNSWWLGLQSVSYYSSFHYKSLHNAWSSIGADYYIALNILQHSSSQNIIRSPLSINCVTKKSFEYHIINSDAILLRVTFLFSLKSTKASI